MAGGLFEVVPVLLPACPGFSSEAVVGFASVHDFSIAVLVRIV